MAQSPESQGTTNPSSRNKFVAVLLAWTIFGVFGAHYFYLGDSQHGKRRLMLCLCIIPLPFLYVAAFLEGLQYILDSKEQFAERVTVGGMVKFGVGSWAFTLVGGVVILLGVVNFLPASSSFPDTSASITAEEKKQEAQRQDEEQQRKEQEERDKRFREASEERAKKYSGCRIDIDCWGDKNWVDAETYCARRVEGYAKYDHEWTDGWAGKKFSAWYWEDMTAGIVRYFGNEIKFQNGFGAWQGMYYNCYYDTENEKVLSAQVAPR